jgi:hypothetical protein
VGKPKDGAVRWVREGFVQREHAGARHALLPEQRSGGVMTRIEIPVEDARPGDIAVLRQVWWPDEVEAEVYKFGSSLYAAGYLVRGFRVQRIYREVPDLPTEPGSVIRATIDGVPDSVVFRRQGKWFSFAPIKGHLWHDTEDIDLSTVRVGRIVFEEDAS